MRQIPLEITRLPGLIRSLEYKFGSNKTAAYLRAVLRIQRSSPVKDLQDTIE